MSTFKSMIKTTLTPIALCMTLSIAAIAAPAFAKKDHQQKHDGMRQLLSELSLTDIQKQDIRQIQKQSREDRGLFSNDEKSLRKELGNLVHSSKWDQAAVENAITQNQALMQDNALQRATIKSQVWNLLTEAQQTEFVAQLETHKAKRSEMSSEGKSKGKGKGKGKGNRGRDGKKLKHLGLSEEQLAAVKAIKSEAKGNNGEIKAKLKSYKQAERSLIQSADFNPEAWQALNSEYQADFKAMAILTAKSQHDIWNLLTPEQQAKALEKLEKGKPGNRNGRDNKNGRSNKKGKKHKGHDSV